MTLGGGADEIGDAFDAALQEGGTGIVLDLTRLAYLDSAGIGAVIVCAKHAGESGAVLKIAVAPAGAVRRIFEITQLERGFEIFEDAESAAASFV
jgi:anti-sigma B factor antagonist